MLRIDWGGDNKRRVQGIYICIGFFLDFKRCLVCGNERMIASRWETSFYLAAAAFVDTCVDKENLHSCLD